MIRRLNAMRLDDPEYAPVYYKVMTMDRSGTAKDCVEPPRKNRSGAGRTPGSGSSAAPPRPENGSSSATYPNNIPLGQRGDFRGCYGCMQDGHHISSCPEIKVLVERGLISVHPETRKYVMINGDEIMRRRGESIATAAERVAAAAPRVLLGILDLNEPRRAAVHNFYQEQARRARMEDVDDDTTTDENGSEEYESSVSTPMTASAERTETGIKKARKQVFDGVYPPGRDRPKGRTVRDMQEERRNPVQETRNNTARPGSEPALAPSKPPSSNPEKGRNGATSDHHGAKRKDEFPELTPIDARKVRFEEDIGMEMREAQRRNKKSKPEQPTNEPVVDGLGKSQGRQSELSTTVDRQRVMDRILDIQIPMSLREIMVTLKELRTDFQELIKVKNVRAVLLGNSQDHPLIANYPLTGTADWPRSEGILIKIELETNGRMVCAIIDTGSQLDVVRSDVAALSIRQSMDMSQVTNMNDANGGRGQLQGWIRNVEFNCGGAQTVTDLWVSQKAPFELLLGRPWQRGNLVSIDEHVEGTYLIFKDHTTKRPRYELLAVPYDGPVSDFRGETNQYQSFMLTLDHIHPKFRFIPDKEFTSTKSRCEVAREVPNSEEKTPKAVDADLDPARAAAKKQRADARSPRNGSCRNKRIRENGNRKNVLSHLKKVYKGGEQGQEELRPSPYVPMSLSRALEPFSNASNPSMPLGNPHYPRAPLENVQYLSRAVLHHPPNTQPLTMEPSQNVLAGAVQRAWTHYVQGHPSDINPTFAAAPQSEYLGRTVLSDGQVVHRSANLNVLRTFRNPETGQLFSIMCHEIVDHYESQLDPSVAWKYEVFYPSAERLRSVMCSMSPIDPPPEGETGFPMHATSLMPTMLPMEQHLNLAMFWKTYRQQQANPPNGTIAPTDLHLPAMLCESGPVSPLPAIVDADLERFERLAAVIKERAAHHELPELGVDCREPFFHPPFTADFSSSSDESDSSLPELMSPSSSENAVGNDTLPAWERVVQFPGTPDYDTLKPPAMDEPTNCGLCGGSAHLISVCPNFPAAQPNAVKFLNGPPGFGRPTREAYEEALVQLRTAESIEKEVRQVVVPAIDEIMALPDDAYGELAEKAREMQTMMGEFADRMEAQKELRARKELDEMARELEAVLVPEPHLDELPPHESTSPNSYESHTLYVHSPNLNKHRGALITRDVWSSSEVSSASTSSFEEITPYRPSQVNASPSGWPDSPVTEWSVNSHEFLADPREILNMAIARAMKQAYKADTPVHECTSKCEVTTDGDGDSQDVVPPDSGTPGSFLSESSASIEEREAFAPDHYRTRGRPVPLEPPGNPPCSCAEASFDQQVDIRTWIHYETTHQQTLIERKDAECSRPLDMALQVIHGALRRFVNYMGMAYHDFRGMQLVADEEENEVESGSISPLRLDQISTNLDHSLPSLDPGRQSQGPAANETGKKRKESGSSSDSDNGDVHRPKKKHRTDGDLLRKLVTKCAALLASGLAEGDVIQLSAGYRAAGLESLRRTINMVGQRYGISVVRKTLVHSKSILSDQITSAPFRQDFCPKEYVTHPVYTDFEAAQMHTVYRILRHHQRNELADTFYKALTLQFHDEYLIALMLNAKHLEELYPDSEARYWELLHVPETVHDEDSDMFSTDKDETRFAELDYLPEESADHDTVLYLDTAVYAAGLHCIFPESRERSTNVANNPDPAATSQPPDNNGSMDARDAGANGSSTMGQRNSAIPAIIDFSTNWYAHEYGCCTFTN
ncbi:hypothetical protein C8R43DRAFT_941736 [Mycena crocata]|nr:hypothetical protein C8R43DRAFT_941736 [Mycena crocata]